MGDIGNETRLNQYWPLSMVRAEPKRRWTLEEKHFTNRWPGPKVGTSAKLAGGLIHYTYDHNFCESCNRGRLTCTGTLFMCLGQHDCADLRTPLRDGKNLMYFKHAIHQAISRKPKGHDFAMDRRQDAVSS